MIAVSFQNAYFEECEFRSDQVADLWNAVDSFTMIFPSGDSDISISDGVSYRSAHITDSFGGNLSITRVYSFTKTEYSYTWHNTRRPIFRCTLTSYDDDEVDIDSYAYVWLWQGAGFFGNYRYTWNFINASELPAGLAYDFSDPSLFVDDSPILFLYGFGNQVYTMFPSIQSLLWTDVAGNTFFWLLTSGFLVYCGYVIAKWLIGIIP